MQNQNHKIGLWQCPCTKPSCVPDVGSSNIWLLELALTLLVCQAIYQGFGRPWRPLFDRLWFQLWNQAMHPPWFPLFDPVLLENRVGVQTICLVQSLASSRLVSRAFNQGFLHHVSLESNCAWCQQRFQGLFPPLSLEFDQGFGPPWFLPLDLVLFQAVLDLDFPPGHCKQCSKWQDWQWIWHGQQKHVAGLLVPSKANSCVCLFEMGRERPQSGLTKILLVCG